MTRTAAQKKTTATSSTARKTSGDGFSADERAAMKERAKELRAEARGAKDRAKGEADLRSKIDEMPAGPSASSRRPRSSVRYAELGFNEEARLDDGTMWPTAYAITELTAADEKRIATLVTKAVG